MSSAVVKKRGRPEKINPAGGAGALPASTKPATTRAKSTQAGTRTKAAPATSATTPGPQRLAARPAVASAKPRPASRTPLPSMRIPWEKQTMPPPPTSKILDQVKDQEAKQTPGRETPAATAVRAPVSPSKPPPATMAAKEASGPARRKDAPSPTPTRTTASSPRPPVGPPPPPARPIPPAAPKPPPTPRADVPMAARDSAVVSGISTRTGARPNTAGSQQLPKNYKPVARRVTAAIVALPIALVTGYVLFQRLVLGQEKKKMP
ncbi:hypothetical protein B2J93_61 [Marssonina coronariae]|uniref:Uncharacterized protein n=1 Tax=Diplocarpon coronariae TaxID=2795749 RepID=A0A218Z5F6_9HELO|nr:hypothetical protein B2J93_61 [Marssonina coronariae]